MYPRNLFYFVILVALTLNGCPSSESTTTPEYTPAWFDCSSVQHLPLNSSEAQKIVEEFIANYNQDFPTEYMAIEQLWVVDKLGEYAVIQGRVTQEESDIIVVQLTQHGYVLAARYHTHMDLPAFGYSSIPEYFAAELPLAPSGLFNCLDLSRFTGESKP